MPQISDEAYSLLVDNCESWQRACEQAEERLAIAVEALKAVNYIQAHADPGVTQTTDTPENVYRKGLDAIESVVRSALDRIKGKV